MLLEKFILSLNQEGLLNSKDRVLLGVSGGSDSIAMLQLFNEVKDKLNITLGIAHLNHGLRGRAANADDKLVASAATKLKLPYFSKYVDVDKLAKQHKLSIEDAARSARYDFFIKTCEDHGYNKLALAHTSDDQLETIILKFLRGSGLQGLLGIQAQRSLTDKITVIRPLLTFSKLELQKYCRQNKLKWREDKSNKQLIYTRNKLRLSILPQLKNLNPNLLETLNGTSKIFQEENKFLDDIAKEALTKLVQKQTDTGLRLNTVELLTYPKAIQRRVVRLALEKVQGSLQDIYLPFIENFLDNGLTTIKLNEQKKLKVSKERL